MVTDGDIQEEESVVFALSPGEVVREMEPSMRFPPIYVGSEGELDSVVGRFAPDDVEFGPASKSERAPSSAQGRSPLL